MPSLTDLPRTDTWNQVTYLSPKMMALASVLGHIIPSCPSNAVGVKAHACDWPDVAVQEVPIDAGVESYEPFVKQAVSPEVELFIYSGLGGDRKAFPQSFVDGIMDLHGEQLTSRIISGNPLLLLSDHMEEFAVDHFIDLGIIKLGIHSLHPRTESFLLWEPVGLVDPFGQASGLVVRFSLDIEGFGKPQRVRDSGGDIPQVLVVGRGPTGSLSGAEEDTAESIDYGLALGVQIGVPIVVV